MYVRIEASFIKVKYGVVGTRMREVVRAAKDVGGGGIRFPVNKRLPHGVKLDLELTLPHETVPIQAQAQVIWSARIHGRRTYEAGCQFTRIDPLDRGKIIRRVHQALRDRKPA
ncbi:MAG: PilZ domain-containing protein [Candidatus Acidiferrum sp.]|jgi:c-di-GMP-binding flagellar brake protein YcgR